MTADRPPEKITCGSATAQLYPDAPDWDGPAMAVGRIACDSAADGAALLESAARSARAARADALIGPMEGDTWHSYRLVTDSDGRPPFLMEPATPPHLLAAFETAGFAPVGRYFSAAVPLGAHPAPAPGAISIETWQGEDPEALFAEVHALSTRAFAGNAFYRPIPRDAFLAMYMPIVPMLRPDLVLFARDGAGDLAGFLFGIPDYAQGPAPDAAILKTYASLHPGAGHALAARFHHTAQEAGFATAIHALIHDDNLSARRSESYGGTIFRRYALMGRRLD